MQRVALVVLVGAALAGAVAAQEGRPVENPYQAEVPFALGEATDPGVVIDGVRWSAIRVVPKGDVRPGARVKSEVQLGFENRSDSRVRIDVVLLFEDASGNTLHRLEVDPLRLAAGKRRTFRERYRLPADALSAARKLYLFCEVTPD